MSIDGNIVWFAFFVLSFVVLTKGTDLVSNSDYIFVILGGLVMVGCLIVGLQDDLKTKIIVIAMTVLLLFSIVTVAIEFANKVYKRRRTSLRAKAQKWFFALPIDERNKISEEALEWFSHRSSLSRFLRATIPSDYIIAKGLHEQGKSD